MNQVKDKDMKAREEIKDITTLGCSGTLCWWPGSSGGGCMPGPLQVCLPQLILCPQSHLWRTHMVLLLEGSRSSAQAPVGGG